MSRMADLYVTLEEAGLEPSELEIGEGLIECPDCGSETVSLYDQELVYIYCCGCGKGWRKVECKRIPA